MAIPGGQRGGGPLAFLLQLHFMVQLGCMAARTALDTKKHSPKPAWLGLSSQRILLPAALHRAPLGRRVSLELPGSPCGVSHSGLRHFLWQNAAVVFEGEWVCACGGLLMQECEDSPGVVGVTSDGGQGSQMWPAL